MTPLTLAEQIPAVCLIDDVCRILQMSKAQFFALRAAGTFPIPELLPKIDKRPRFRGADVLRYLAGEMAQAS